MLLPRLVSLAGDVFSLVGGVNAWAADGGPAAHASVFFPLSTVFLNNGDILVSDWASRRMKTIH